jgi:hypothetical protein
MYMSPEGLFPAAAMMVVPSPDHARPDLAHWVCPNTVEDTGLTGPFAPKNARFGYPLMVA